MKNFIQPGNTVTVPAPAGGAVSGAGVLIESLFGVAAYDAPAGQPLEIATVGAYALAKVPAAAFALGAAVYWNESAKACDVHDDGRPLIGVALAAAADGAATATVRLNGTFGAASIGDAAALAAAIE